jgi:preprotein translocase subunit SecD
VELPPVEKVNQAARMFPRRFLIGFFTLVLAGLALGGCASKTSKKDYPVAVIRFMVEATAQENGGIVRLPQSGVVIPVAPKTYFTEYDITRCDVIENELGKSLAFQFTEQATRDLFRFTATNQGKRLVIVLNGVAIGAQRISTANSQGFVVAYVEFPETELFALAKNITRTSEDARKEAAKAKK